MIGIGTFLSSQPQVALCTRRRVRCDEVALAVPKHSGASTHVRPVRGEAVREHFRQEGGGVQWESIVPFAAIIPVAAWTKQVIPALAVGLLTGAYLVRPTPLGGVQQASTYLIGDLGRPINLYVIGFLYVFAGIVQLIQATGGIKGFTVLASRHIRTRRQTLWLIWITVVGTFSASALRIITVAPLAKALQRRVPATKERLSFLIEATGVPLIALIPVGTSFIGYMTAAIALSLKAAHVTDDPYRLFLSSIGYNFFSLAAVALAFAYTLVGHPRLSLGKAVPTPAPAPGDIADHDRAVYLNAHQGVSENLPAKPLNLFVPLGTAVVLTLFIPWWDGFAKTHDAARALLDANVVEAMFVAIVITLVVTVAWLALGRFPLSLLVREFLQGGNNLMPAILLLALVWGIASATEHLGLAPFMTASLGGVPRSLAAPTIFVLGALLAYVLGSSFGVWGILMPIAVVMAQATAVSLPVLIGAVFGTGAFGELVSPFSDGTVTISRIMGLDAISYARYKLKHSLLPLALATLGYYLVGLR
jgi:tetracycline resistance efflux pump